MIVNSDFYRVQSQYHCAPELLVTGSKVRLQPLTFVHSGKTYTFTEPQDFVVQSQAFRCTVTGYLVVVKETGAPALLVDELLHDGVDLPYSLTDGGPFEPLTMIYSFDVPPETTDLANVSITVYRNVPAPQTQEKSRG